MRYFKNIDTDAIFAYDEKNQIAYINKALENGLVDISDIYPPKLTEQEELEEQQKNIWASEFYDLDRHMPRYAEDIIEALDNKNKISKEAKERAERKKELRAEGKSKGYI